MSYKSIYFSDEITLNGSSPSGAHFLDVVYTKESIFCLYHNTFQQKQIL